ncbi:hypothetical protein [Methanotorris igneus]|uniref:Uncharacterized protein n=1 Tax=Methanotorris igneus (strain DSM 5666 / JCM 11834 / Kol 5) TaxID=880724 RepID=F6BDZ4_METIK|nr:hypothetical protein [Methanotorris igneus]AEF96705.1 hypothetical protein Metig_1167 [Methanotorris igneus Kol 5]
MIPPEILVTLVVISIALNVVLFVKVVMLQRELNAVKKSTQLTKEEVEKLNERLKRLKMGGQV